MQKKAKNYTLGREKLYFLCNDMINSNIKYVCFIVCKNKTSKTNKTCCTQ